MPNYKALYHEHFILRLTWKIYQQLKSQLLYRELFTSFSFQVVDTLIPYTILYLKIA